MASQQAERAFERLTQCALAALQHNPEGFEPWLPPWLRLVLDAALLAVDAPTVRAGRAKRRMALVCCRRRTACSLGATLPVLACQLPEKSSLTRLYASLLSLSAGWSAAMSLCAALGRDSVARRTLC